LSKIAERNIKSYRDFRQNKNKNIFFEESLLQRIYRRKTLCNLLIHVPDDLSRDCASFIIQGRALQRKTGDDKRHNSTGQTIRTIVRNLWCALFELTNHNPNSRITFQIQILLLVNSNYAHQGFRALVRAILHHL
jgi:hypothetical protein